MTTSSDDTTALLPLTRPSALDSVPIYSLVLSTYDLISSRVDTLLKYDQLRSPQVHSFLIKPIVVECRRKLSPGTLYALLANMIQFSKESSSNAAMTGVMATRALICEIVATKLLKEFDSEELMNALTYDFYPLATGTPEGSRIIPRWQRLSTLELAIKAEAKRFLAHPVVIQVLQEIWNGSIMFQSSIHKLHRVKFANEEEIIASGYGRRGPGIRYKYEDASILKLSRLRVPRYRHLLNLASFCVLLALYLFVLAKPLITVSTTEVVFGLWSLGFVLDEIVAFTDVGSTLYFLSLWNSFDLIILLQLIGYATFRVLALSWQSADAEYSNTLLSISYDILATVAIFLFPRLFSILDNYESFSRMIIAVRKMSIDLAVSWLVIVMLSSGFWVAFTMAFARNIFSPSGVAFDLLKILFGFTPTVWENWRYYSPIGRFILLFYLFITHFVILTILIAVLSNSFSAITENSHEEHQYLLAVNTISMIKSESSSLFSYAPPLTLIEWVVRPLFYVVPLRTFLLLNRTIIKITHFPILYAIFIYERLYLRFVQVRSKMAEDAERERRKQQDERIQMFINQPSSVHGSGAETPIRKPRKREPKKKLQSSHPKVSQYELLDEVFRRPYKGTVKVKKQPESRDVEVNSDPEDAVKRLYDSRVADDDDYSIPTVSGRTDLRGLFATQPNDSISTATGGYSRSMLRTVPSEVALAEFLETRHVPTDLHRTRLFSTTSSLLRAGELGLSPTRSTSSILGRHRSFRSRTRDWMLRSQAQKGEEDLIEDEAVEDIDNEDDEDASVISNPSGDVKDELISRMDNLEASFKKIETLLQQIAKQASSSQ
jgi:hypothetical protein